MMHYFTKDTAKLIYNNMNKLLKGNSLFYLLQ